MKKYLIYMLLLLLLVGCTKVETSNEAEIIDSSNINNEIEIIDNRTEDENNSKNNKEENEVVNNIELHEGKVKSPLTGLYIDEEKINNRPIAVMLDNYYKARPQAGLSEADIVYEILAEGNITRYLAIFHTGEPKIIGPVRSARPYFISKALEYNPLYVHVGGSQQALIDVRDLKMADIDALSSGKNVFWRQKHKPIPNNMYTDMEAILREAKRKGYTLTSNLTSFNFNTNDTLINGDDLISIKFPYKDNYASQFKYDNETKQYLRFINNVPHKDETTNIHLSAKNIIVQFADNKILDSEGRLEIDIIGEGKGYYITNGKLMDIIWKKENRRSQTRIFDVNGSEISLNPGITWFQIVPSNMSVQKE